MKNQYFGDGNDYFKYDLLIFLAEELSGIKKLSIVWMLTEDDGSKDGGSGDYSRGAGNKDLFRFLQTSLNEGRQVSRLKEYFENNHPGDAGFRFEFLHNMKG